MRHHVVRSVIVIDDDDNNGEESSSSHLPSTSTSLDYGSGSTSTDSTAVPESIGLQTIGVAATTSRRDNTGSVDPMPSTSDSCSTITTTAPTKATDRHHHHHRRLSDQDESGSGDSHHDGAMAASSPPRSCSPFGRSGQGRSTLVASMLILIYSFVYLLYAQHHAVLFYGMTALTALVVVALYTAGLSCLAWMLVFGSKRYSSVCPQLEPASDHPVTTVVSSS